MAAQAASETGLKEVVKKRQIEATRAALHLSFSMGKDIEVTKPGWIGKRLSDLPRREFTKQELVDDHGMACFPWDGRWVFRHKRAAPLADVLCRTTHLLLDNEQHVIGALVGQPKDAEGWQKVHDEAYKSLQAAASSMGFSHKETSHRRGAFPAVAHGISFGGGQAVSLFFFFLQTFS